MHVFTSVTANYLPKAAALAHSIKRGEIASLRLALSHTVDISLLVPFLSELNRAFNGLE